MTSNTAAPDPRKGGAGVDWQAAAVLPALRILVKRASGGEKSASARSVVLLKKGAFVANTIPCVQAAAKYPTRLLFCLRYHIQTNGASSFKKVKITTR